MVDLATRSARRSTGPDPLLVAAREQIARDGLGEGVYVTVSPDGRTLVELVIDPLGLVEVAASDLPVTIARLSRTEVAVLVAVVAMAHESGDAATRFTYGALAKAIGWPPPNGREVATLRATLVELTTPSVHRRVVRTRPDVSGLVPPARDSVVGLFRYPARLSPGASREPSIPSVVALEPAYAPLLATGAIRSWTPAALAALPTDAARRLALLASVLTQSPVEPDRVCRARLSADAIAGLLRPDDSNRRRARAVIRSAAAALAADPRYAGTRIDREQLVLERRRPLA